MRYFIVFFVAERDTKGFKSITTNGKFVHWSVAIEQIQKQNGLKNVILTNLIEVSESDYNDWNSSLPTTPND